MTLHNATMPAGRALPAQYLFRPANPALSSRSLGRRDSFGPICADYETKCAQGDWCCDTGETCSFDTINGAYLCCGASAGANGCSKVCAAGTFQCGSVCCTFGQVCFGGDTVSGYCVNQNVQSSTRPSTTLVAQTTTRHQTSETDTRGANPALTPLSSGSQSNNRDTGPSQGVSIGLQVAIGIAVPLVVILIAIGAWFCFSRWRRGKRVPVVVKDTESSPSPSASVSASSVHRDFPSLPKNAMIVSTPVQPFEFGQPRTPKTSLPPPDTSAGTVLSEDERDPGSTPTLAAPRLATPIDLLNAVANKPRSTH